MEAIIYVFSHNNALFETIILNARHITETLIFLNGHALALESEMAKPQLIICNTPFTPPKHLSSVPSIRLGIDLLMPFHITDLLSLIYNNIHNQEYDIGIHKFILHQKIIIDCHGNILLMLTEKEAELLAHLIQNGENGVDENELLTKIWRYNATIQSSTVEAHLHRLRTKLCSIERNYKIIAHNKKYVLTISI